MSHPRKSTRSTHLNKHIERVDFGPVAVFLGEKNGKYPDGNQVLIRGADTLAALDTPIVSNHIGADFDAAELVVLGHAHEDHMAGLHRLPGARVYAPVADLPAVQSWDGFATTMGMQEQDQQAQVQGQFQRDFFYTPRPDAQGYEDGACWELGGTKIRAIHMPGHTAGHSVLVIEPHGIAFIGDIDLTGFGPYYGDPGSSLQDFRASLARLPDIPASVWITSHHRGVYTDRDIFMRDLAAYTEKLDERGQRLLSLLAEGPQTLEQLVEKRLLYPPGFDAPWVRMVETRTILRHLEELLCNGRVALADGGVYRLG
ncbi:MBL fold metallo-hydrolase [Lampropedia aestuarii]|uniref:MBL fold metallo-hydrolase n=1 Tax=Lampropedia aestuarii TaxID=2562762 RepID=UPI003CC810BA